MTRFHLTGRTSRALAVAVLCLAPLAVLPAGCKLFRKAPMQSTVNTREPRVAGQLLDGFYGIESAAWRWTAKDFSVKLKTPPGAAQKGGILRLMLNLPPEVIEKSVTVTLSTTIGGSALPPETYSTSGPFIYQRDVPANLLGAKETIVNFSLDKTIRPSGPDRRDLGVIVSTIALESK